jgi:hypothetical protein
MSLVGSRRMRHVVWPLFALLVALPQTARGDAFKE